ncbi:hypothetical protein AB0M95_27595 [Sphaerisporangium sp. NPDC051017]|uniref:hypothetical protein n=1 Tax=Sphaerisporangium sp. NPDC051017 TaxID=3154636 RepID=UPI003418647F
MGIRITPAHMALTDPTGATTATAELREGAWQVTGYPGRRFTRDQAITALTLTEVLAAGPRPRDEMWRHMIDAWRAELDLPPLTYAPDRPVRDATPSAKTTAAPRNPAHSKANEVTPS